MDEIEKAINILNYSRTLIDTLLELIELVEKELEKKNKNVDKKLKEYGIDCIE